MNNLLKKPLPWKNIVLGMALCLVLLVTTGALKLWHYVFDLRPTPFSLSIDSTSLAFTVSPSSAEANDQKVAGLLAQQGAPFDMEIQGCRGVEPDGEGPKTLEKCSSSNNLKLQNVQLDKVVLEPGTYVELSVSDQAVSHQGLTFLMRSPSKEKQARVKFFTYPNTASTFKAEHAQGSLVRHIVPLALPVTLVLTPLNGRHLLIEEHDLSLQPYSSIHFHDGDRHPLLGEHNTLILPEVPTELGTLKLRNNKFEIKDLQSATITRLALLYSEKGVPYLHAEIDGKSSSIMIHDSYANSDSNAALSLFDANSGKDRKLRSIAIGALILALLSVVSSVLGIILHSFDLTEKILAVRGDERAKRIIALPEVELEDGPEVELGEPNTPKTTTGIEG